MHTSDAMNQNRLRRRALLNDDDPARAKYGAAKDSYMEETAAIFAELRAAGVRIDTTRKALAYNPEQGRPGTLIFDSEASLAALRHEAQHFRDNRDLGFPSLTEFLKSKELFWRMEFRAYLAELSFAREVKDFDLGRAILENARRRKRDIYGESP